MAARSWQSEDKPKIDTEDADRRKLIALGANLPPSAFVMNKDADSREPGPHSLETNLNVERKDIVSNW